jgi:hypothetical protein
MKQLRSIDWEAIAGIAAACVALVLHLLHIADEGTLLAVALVILALLLLRDLHREDQDEQEAKSLQAMQAAVARLEAAVKAPDIILVGPRDLRSESERFARQARGEMLWFNVCLSMFEPQELFDVLLRPAIENPAVTGVQFVLSPEERSRWEGAVLPKVSRLAGAGKLREPRWVPLEESISYILADNANGEAEAQVSFWGEPFMARQRGHDIPRYVLHVQPRSPLIAGLVELERGYHSPGRA